MKFGIVVRPNAPLEALAERSRLAEELGFDQLWTEDHTRDYQDAKGPWFDGWTVLAAMVTWTERIRIGTLVSNAISRHPVRLAKQAAAVDHLSNGRLELGIGTGIAGFDHEAMGVPYWEPKERVRRYAEYVRIVDELLSTDAPFTFEGEYYRTSGASTRPPTVQRPRPPITVGGQAPTVRRVAAERADRWNTHGPFGKTPEEIAAVTRRQNEEMDERCATFGRDPRSVVRSLLMFDSLDAWQHDGALERTVELFVPAGIQEFVLFWPRDDDRARLERLATEVIPALRGESG